ncbi:MAG: hypothetical protein H0V40_01560 [Actinobacteria bacterium]|nr:hypothetical protein [Actinomycetota bacterium]
MTLLDELVPSPDFSERHSIAVAAPPELVYEAVKAATPGEMRLVRQLFAIRSLGSKRGLPAERGRSLLEQLVEFGFAVLAEEPGSELVFGTIDQPWRLRGAESVELAGGEDFRRFERPGFIKAAGNFAVRPHAGGTLLETETRVLATDPAARRKFGRYWRVIRPGSGLIRHSWLRAAKRRAEASSPS